MEFKIEGELVLHGETINSMPQTPARDWLSQVMWRTASWEMIFIKDMADTHLRNAALFLMGMGYKTCYADESVRILYLRIFRMEWERRLNERKHTWNGDIASGA